MADDPDKPPQQRKPAPTDFEIIEEAAPEKAVGADDFDLIDEAAQTASPIAGAPAADPVTETASPGDATSDRDPADAANETSGTYPATDGDAPIAPDDEMEITAESDDDSPLFESTWQPESPAPRSATPFGRLLEAIAAPERRLQRAWRDSRLRGHLLDRFEWYRQRDENRRMEQIIDETYGEVALVRRSPGAFARDNLLFSLLLLGLLAALGWLGIRTWFPDLLPAEQVVSRPARSVVKSPPAPPAETTPREINYVNKADVETLLAHCLVMPAGRQSLDQALATEGYHYSNRNLAIAVEEVRAAIDHYDRNGVEALAQDVIYRYAVFQKVLIPALAEVRAGFEGFLAERRTVEQRISATEETIEALRRGRQDMTSVNQQIALRSELDDLRSALAKGPRGADIARLQTSLARLESLLQPGGGLPERETDEPDARNAPDWLQSVPPRPATDMEQALRDTVLPVLAEHTVGLASPSAQLVRFHTYELMLALEHSERLAARIRYRTETETVPFTQELSGQSRRLHGLVPNADHGEWLGLAPCIEKAETAALATLNNPATTP